MKSTKVKDVMTAHPVMIQPDMTLKDASITMRDIGCGVLPVGHEDRIKGVITDRDIVVRAISRGKNAEEETVKDYMSTGVYDCHENDAIETAVEVMRKNRISRLIVKDKAGRMVGILSFGNVLWRTADADEISAVVRQAVRAKAA